MPAAVAERLVLDADGLVPVNLVREAHGPVVRTWRATAPATGRYFWHGSSG